MPSTAARLPFTLGAVLVAGLLGLAGTAAAQQAPEILTEVVVASEGRLWQLHPADSARVLSGARSAQSRFELVRRSHLPWTWDRGSNPCDERIGRFCLWYGDGDSKWQPPPEPERVLKARGDLIARLDTAAAMIPGDWWIAGHRVHYLVEAERLEEAAAAARACRSPEPGWCAALLGYALHMSGDYPRADSAFAAAIEQMPPRQRERWTDLSSLLERDAIRAYRRLEPAEREAFETRFWWLANPLYMVPGNDRRTEHFTRHVLDRLQDRARQTEGISWGSDLRELLLRYGWPAGWERIRPRTPALSTGSVHMVTRYPSGSRYFDPALRFVEEPLDIGEDEWDLEQRRARTSYAPSYAAPVEEPEYQVAIFQRADSAVILAGLQLSPDSLHERPPAEMALVLAANEHQKPFIVRQDSAAARGILRAITAAAPTLLSLEALAREPRRAARVRYALALGPLPPHGLAVSDLLLLDSPESLPDSLAAAIPSMRPSTEARSRERLGIFWEVYGLSAGDLPLQVAVHLINENVGALRRAAIRARLVRQPTPLTVHWLEVPDEPGDVHPRTLAIDLPDLSPGSYTLQLTLTARGREPLVAQRTITVVE